MDRKTEGAAGTKYGTGMNHSLGWGTLSSAGQLKVSPGLQWPARSGRHSGHNGELALHSAGDSNDQSFRDAH